MEQTPGSSLTPARLDNKIMLSTTTIDKFKAGLRGELIQRSDPHYEEARKLYNAMIDKRPLLIARCADVADVIAAALRPGGKVVGYCIAGPERTGEDFYQRSLKQRENSDAFG